MEEEEEEVAARGSGCVNPNTPHIPAKLMVFFMQKRILPSTERSRHPAALTEHARKDPDTQDQTTRLQV